MAQRNVGFKIPKEFGIKQYHRPIILVGNSTKLDGPLFVSESFDHILSHPPYKDCIQYSSHIEDDLSRVPDMEDFFQDMKLVAETSYRLLKPRKRCTLAIGDNRK